MPLVQDYFGLVLSPHFDSAALQMPVPSAGIFDLPDVCVRINSAYVPAIIGVLARLLEPDCWSGTAQEQDYARDQIEALIGEFSILQTCGSAEVGAITDIRIDPVSCSIIQVMIDGVWVDKLAKDLLFPSRYVTDISAYDNQGVQGLTIDYQTLDDCVGGNLQQSYDFPAPIPGPQGEQGEPGAQGAQGIQGVPGVPGADGIDGECECEDTTPPPPLPTGSVACGIAQYLMTWHDGIFDDFINTIDAATTVTTGITAFLPLIPGVGTIAQVLVDAATAAIAGTAAAMRADVTSTQREEWTCGLFTALEPLAAWDKAAFDTWLATAKLEATALGQQVFLDTLGAYTVQELNRRAAIGAATPSSLCDELCGQQVGTCTAVGTGGISTTDYVLATAPTITIAATWGAPNGAGYQAVQDSFTWDNTGNTRYVIDAIELEMSGWSNNAGLVATSILARVYCSGGGYIDKFIDYDGLSGVYRITFDSDVCTDRIDVILLGGLRRAYIRKMVRRRYQNTCP